MVDCHQGGHTEAAKQIVENSEGRAKACQIEKNEQVLYRYLDRRYFAPAYA